MRTTRVACGLLAVLWAFVCVPATGQRVQFPSAVPSPGPIPGPAAAGPAPTATLEGTIQPPSVNWDPYATPGSTPPTLLPQDPYLQPGQLAPPGGTFARMQKLVQEIRLDYVWMPGSGPKEFGIHDAELSATFAIPFLYNTQTPLLVTPGFAMHFWNGPESPPADADLPPYVFDAYLDSAWNPQATPWLAGELAFRVGVYSDFRRVTNESLRYMGHGYAVLSFTPSFKVKAGAMYLDRNHVKILPAGGLIWTPNPDIRFEILFPDPKITRRLTTMGNTEWWGYVRGEYGGGAWTVKRVSGVLDSADYNDMRVALGLEFIRLNGLTGLFEAGLAFEREILYGKSPDVFEPNSTVFLRGGVAY